MSIMHDRRMDEVREHMKALGLSALIVSETAALWYLTGESIHPGERLTVLVLQAKGPAFWIRNRLFPLKSGTSWTMAEAKAAGYIADISFEDGEDGMKLLSDHLPEGKVGVDKVWPSSFLLDLMSRRKDLKFVNGSPAVDSARAVKDEREIGIMRLASNINDRAMKKISRWITPGVTERECAEKLLAIYKEEGAEGFSFPPIVSFGAHGADPHHMPDGTPLKRRETVLFDISPILFVQPEPAATADWYEAPVYEEPYPSFAEEPVWTPESISNGTTTVSTGRCPTWKSLSLHATSCRI